MIVQKIVSGYITIPGRGCHTESVPEPWLLSLSKQSKGVEV